MRRCRAAARRDRRATRDVAAGRRRRPGGHARGGEHAAGPGRRLVRALGCEVWLKVEGANPTGSFKDRGMTVALSRRRGQRRQGSRLRVDRQHLRLRGGVRRRAGLRPLVLLPAGRIATGKLAQAIMHGAQVVQVDGNFDDCLELARSARPRLPGRTGQLGQPDPDRGPEDGRVRGRGRPGRRARPARAARRQRREHHRLLAGLHASSASAGLATPRRRGCGGSRRRARRRWCWVTGSSTPETRGHGDPDRQPGLGGAGHRRPRRVGRSASTRSPTSRSWPRSRCWPRARGCSSSRPRPRGWPGCWPSDAAGEVEPGQRIAVTRHRTRAQGHRHRTRQARPGARRGGRADVSTPSPRSPRAARLSLAMSGRTAAGPASGRPSRSRRPAPTSARASTASAWPRLAGRASARGRSTVRAARSRYRRGRRRRCRATSRTWSSHCGT